jgi:glutaminyl-tRNA synthetase
VLCVQHPLKVTLTNYPEGQVEELDASYYPHDVPKTGSRKVPFSRDLYVDRADFMEDAPKKFYRLSQGREVRLRFGYLITCNEVVKNDAGEVVELRCTYDPETRSGNAADGRKVQGTIHWVSAPHALDCEVRLYDRLFLAPDPDAVEDGKDFLSALNPESLVTVQAKIEPSVARDPIGTRYQFERTGYFMSDIEDSTPENLVFNRIVSLRDSWAKVGAKS